jgi:hypothetical protein
MVVWACGWGDEVMREFAMRYHGTFNVALESIEAALSASWLQASTGFVARIAQQG